MQKITPFIWFEENADEAVTFYTSVFKDAKVVGETALPENVPGPKDNEGKNKAMIATLELLGQRFILLNGGPAPGEGFKLNSAISFVIECADQAEVDYYWEKLPEGGGKTNICGWLTDKFGLTWQVTPTRLSELMGDPDKEKAARVASAMMQMEKIDIAKLEAAAAGA